MRCIRVVGDEANRRVVSDDGTVSLLSALTTPLLPADYLGLVNPLWSTRELHGRVEQVRRETADATTLVIRPGRAWSPARAGQWVRIGVRINGAWQSRTYSVTTPRGDRDARFAITVKAIDGGRVSPHLAFRTTPGTVVRLDPPKGDFVVPATLPDRALYLTGGSGITPVMGMLRTLATRRAGIDIVHVHSALRPDDVIFGAEMRTLGGRLPRYRLREQHTDTDGLFDLASLDAVCPDWRDRAVWACGPRGMLDAIEQHWADARCEHLLHVERFQAPVFAAPDADGGSVRFVASNRHVEVPPGQAILAAGEAAGVAMPSGCRMGICFSCVAPLRTGQVRDLRTGDIHGDEGDLVQTCVSAAAGDCSIDL
jgi:ferredoxin-NADP reductase